MFMNEITYSKLCPFLMESCIISGQECKTYEHIKLRDTAEG